MSGIIVYGSQYGTTKRYAEKLSEKINVSMINYHDMKSLSRYDTVIHFGGLYAGGVMGLKETLKRLPENVKLIIITVGLADVNDQGNTDNIKQSVYRQVPENILKQTEIFHLRGGIDYSKLNIKHKTMMTLLYHKARNLPEEKKTAEVRAMIETYNKAVDFVNFDSLNPIIEAIKQ